eukprot:gene20980-biopygen8609
MVCKHAAACKVVNFGCGLQSGQFRAACPKKVMVYSMLRLANWQISAAACKMANFARLARCRSWYAPYCGSQSGQFRLRLAKWPSQGNRRGATLLGGCNTNRAFYCIVPGALRAPLPHFCDKEHDRKCTHGDNMCRAAKQRVGEDEEFAPHHSAPVERMHGGGATVLELIPGVWK